MIEFLRKIFPGLFTNNTTAAAIEARRALEGVALKTAFNARDRLSEALDVEFTPAELSVSGREVTLVSQHLTVTIPVFEGITSVTGPELGIELVFETPANRLSKSQLRTIRGALRELEAKAAGKIVVETVDLTGAEYISA